MKTKFELGATARDKITGLQGTITAICIYTGSIEQPRIEGVDPSGHFFETWLEASRVEIVEVVAEAS